MGDHRADIKIKFSMYGETESADMWINWSVGSGECYEVDQRVIDFFRDAYLKMRAKYDEQVYELQEKQGMKTLDDHNRDAYARMQGQEPRPKAHVACPKCHSEMEFEDPHMVLTSSPPKRVVICPGCGHRDYKVGA
jgi:hypothetical protein